MHEDSDSTLLPLFPLPLVLYPEMNLPLHIFEERYREMIGRCLEERSAFGLVLSHEGRVFEVGCAARVVDVLRRFPNGEYDILIRGQRRFRASRFLEEKEYLQAEVSFFEDEASLDPEADFRAREQLLERILDSCRPLVPKPESLKEILNFPKGPSDTPSFSLAQRFRFDLRFQQRILEMTRENDRLQLISDFLSDLLVQSEPKPIRDFLFLKGNGRGNGHGKSN